MSKKLNYYQVHKNKKPKKKLPRGLHPNVMRCIQFASEIVALAIKRSQMLVHLSQPIPKYKKGSDSLATVGGVITGEDRTEYFVTMNGEKKRIQEPHNFGRTAKHIGEYEKLTKALKDRMNLTSITSEELTTGNQTFLELMNSISISNKSILNAKAPN